MTKQRVSAYRCPKCSKIFHYSPGSRQNQIFLLMGKFLELPPGVNYCGCQDKEFTLRVKMGTTEV